MFRKIALIKRVLILFDMKALAMFSGGLDSAIAAKLIKAQGVDVIAVKFISPFSCETDYSEKSAKNIGIPLKRIELGSEYVGMLRKPKHGYGAGFNPCIDCKIFMLKKAKNYAKRNGAKFIITGEVLGERPMSQNMRALRIIERESGLEGKLLRPLSAKLLPKTEAEKRGWINREVLLSINGRSRKTQINLAKRLGIREYPTPAGGCLLTYKEYSRKVRDLFKHKKKVSKEDILFLRTGRHFRFGRNKIIVGRSKEDNRQLLKLKGTGDYVFYVPGYGSPIGILQGVKIRKAVEFAASLVAKYSDAKQKEILVKYGKHGSLKRMHIRPAENAGKYMIV